MLQAEGATYDEGGIEAIVFTAEGDMRQALNNAQATAAGLGGILFCYSVSGVMVGLGRRPLRGSGSSRTRTSSRQPRPLLLPASEGSRQKE